MEAAASIVFSTRGMNMSGIGEVLSEVLKSDVYRGLVISIGVIVAMWSIRTSRILARKKQTADMIFASRKDAELIRGLRKISDLHEAKDDNIRKYAAKDMVNTEECQAIRYVLNHYEYVSVGVQAGIYDEDMLRRASCGTVVRLYTQTRDFIDATRKNFDRPTIHQELQWLAKRWERKPLKKREG